jgi:hypothetical protein
MKLVSEQKAESYNYTHHFVGEFYKEYLKTFGLPEYHYYKGTAEYNSVLALSKDPKIAFGAGYNVIRELIKTYGTKLEQELYKTNYKAEYSTNYESNLQDFDDNDNIITVNNTDDANEFDDDEIYEYPPRRQRYGAPDYFKKHHRTNDYHNENKNEQKFWEEKANPYTPQTPPHLRIQNDLLKKEKKQTKTKKEEKFTLMDEFPDFSAFEA